MKPVAVRSAVIVGLVILVATGIVMQLVRNSNGSLPQHSWWELLVVTGVVAGLAAAGWRVRGYVKALAENAERLRRAESAAGDAAAVSAVPLMNVPSPGFARSTLVFAQASALGGAALAGWYLGQAVIHATRWSVPSGRSAAIVLIVLTLGALVVSGVGFLVQKWCTLPEDQR